MRIYVDKDAYSKLKLPEYNAVLRTIEKTKFMHSYFYSQAHIEDLKNDHTTMYKQDLSLMEMIAGKNFISKYFNTSPNVYVTSPKEAYMESIKSAAPVEPNIVDLESPELMDSFQKLKRAIENTEINITKEADYPPILVEYFKKLLNQKSNFNPIEIIEAGLNLNQQLESDNKNYKDLRRYLLENRKYFFPKIENPKMDQNIDNLFESSTFGSDFLSFVENQNRVNLSSPEEIFYHLFNLAYMSLNILAIDGEKNRNANFLHTSRDALHSYYASFCDILVTNDIGLSEKSKLVYEKFGITTQVIKLDDFQSFLETVRNNDENILEEITGNLLESFEDSELKLIEETEDTAVLSCDSKREFFVTFTHIQLSVDFKNQRTKEIILSNPLNKNGAVLAYSYIAQVTDYFYAKFGSDTDSRDNFSDVDLESIKNQNWMGRLWISNFGFLNLGIDISNNVLYIRLLFNEAS